MFESHRFSVPYYAVLEVECLPCETLEFWQSNCVWNDNFRPLEIGLETTIELRLNVTIHGSSTFRLSFIVVVEMDKFTSQKGNLL